MKNILFVLNDFKFGGISKVNTVIANELGKKYAVTIYNSGKGRPRFPVNVPVYQEVYRYGKLSYNLPRFFKKISQYTRLPINPNKIDNERLQKLSSYISDHEIDAVILNSSQITYATILKEKFPKLIVIGWLHNNADIYLNKFFRGFKHHFIAASQTADHLICLTPSDKNSFEPYTQNAICLYNPLGIAPNSFADLDKKIISFVGRIAIAQKGIDYLCAIASQLPEGWQIQVAGPGTKKDKKIFEKLQLRYQTQGKLVYKGGLKGKKLLAHYQNSSIFMMTSRWEGMPLVLAEAMSFGLPIIAFEQTGSNEALQFGKNGLLIPQGDTVEFSHQLNNLIESKALSERLSHASLNRVQDFKLERIIPQWESILGVEKK